MALIDPRTVILLAGAMCGLMSLVLYSLKHNYPASIKGLGEWSSALLILFLAGIVIAGQRVLPDVIGGVMSNFLLWSGVYLAYVGSQRFFGVRPRIVPWMALITAALLVSLWFNVFSPNYTVRLVLFTAMMGIFFAVHAWLIWKQRPITFAKVLTMMVLAGMSAIQVIRLATASIDPSNAGILDTSPLQVSYVASFAFATLLFSIGTVLMATDRLRTELEYMATHDSLTNALTRRHMDEASRIELERCRRHGRSMAVLMMDLDHFKAVNDTYGHQAGDKVLINLVIKVNALLRPSDQLGRHGGEEFMLLLPETSLEDAVQVAERIRAVCAEPAQGPACTVSIGVASALNDQDTVDALLARADAAMYRAKKKGRNRVESN